MPKLKGEGGFDKILKVLKELWSTKQFKVGLLIIAGMIVVLILQLCHVGIF
ncbi:MAG: hypothetical protein UH542_01030 [Bacteroidales bacterium]|nr:hypothetical protein [Bacteroidales bacterium]